MSIFFHPSAEFIKKHKSHHHIALASLALIFSAFGAYVYRNEIVHAATYTFFQTGWGSGVTANTATHASNQTGWSQYSATSTGIYAGAASLALLSTSKTATDDGVVLTALTPATIATGVDSQAVAVSSDGTSVYVANYFSQTISMYSRNTSTGALTALSPATINVGVQPYGVTVSNDGVSVYVSTTVGTIYMYSRNTSTGALTALATPTIAAGTNTRKITISHDGTSVYAVNSGSNDVSMYSRNTSTGALTALATPTIAAGTSPRNITISPDGISVYATNYNSNDVSMYSRNTSTGALTALATPTIATASIPEDVTVSPDGNSVYVSGYSGSINQYSRNTSTGALTALSPSTVSVQGNHHYGITISNDGTSVYVVNNSLGSVSMYSRNTSTGALTALATPTIVAESGSIDVVISPDGSSVYVLNNSSSTISMYRRSTLGGTFGFEAGTNSSTLVTGSGSSASVGLPIGGGILTALSPATTTTASLTPRAIVVSSDGNSAYVVNYASGSVVSMYPRNTSTGALSAKTDYAAGSIPYDVTISPDGTSVYVTNYNSGSVSMYTRNTSTGVLSASTDYAAGWGPQGITVSADGTSVYVTNNSSSTVSMFPRNTSTGVLSAKTDYTTGTNPNGVTVSPDGTSVYVGNGSAATVSMYPRNTSTGVLSAKTDYTTGSNPYYVTISPDGTSVYVANRSSNSVSMFPRNTSTGVLSAKTDYTTGVNPLGVTVSPDGTSVYTANEAAGTVSMFTRNTTTGALSSKTDYTAGADSNDVTVSPDGTSVYVTNYSSSSISMYSRAPAVMSGTFTSASIDLSGKANFTTLDYTTTLPANTALTMDARAGNTATPDGTWTSWTTGISSGGSISALSGNQYFQYRANFSRTDSAATPTLDSVTINYTQYAFSGNLTSSMYNTEASANLISNILWTQDGGGDASTTVKFQVRSASTTALLDSASWCGPSTACDGSDYFTVSTGVVGGIVSGHPLNTGGDDQYLQYKAFLISTGNDTKYLRDVTVQYVVNAPPVISNITASQGSDGTVSVSYDVSDSDNGIGNIVDVTLQYCTTNCTTGQEVWADAVTVSGAGVGIGVALGTGKSIAWTSSTDYPSQYKSNSQKIRIKANDRDAANNLGYGTSATFTLDTTAPAIVSATLDSSTGGSAVGTVALNATDNSTLQYRLCNDSAFPGADTQGNSCAWTTLAASPISTSSITWIPNGTPSNEVMFLQVRDAYSNTTARTIVAPAAPGNFSFADGSNTAIGIYREFLSWSVFVATTSSAFASYKVYHSINNFATAGTLITTITDQSANYYAHTITSATSTSQFYKVVAVNTNGDISNSSVVLSDIPDGSGGIDVTAPYIPLAGIASPTVGNASANITFSTYTDSSMVTGELATSTVYYGTYSGGVPGTCPGSRVDINSYVVNHSAYLTGLTSGTNYYYCVVARDITGNTSTASPSTGGVFTTATGPRITNVTEREITDISAIIFWNTDTSSDSKVYYSATTGGVNGATPVTGSIVTTAGADGAYQHQVGLTGLTAGQTYYFKVTSTDTATSSLTTTDNNNGQYYSFVTLKDTTPPTITGIATPVISSESAVIIWQTNEPATSRVQWGTASSTYTRSTVPDETKSIYHIVTLSSATVDMTSISQVLTPVTTYHYIVRSDDVAGNISQSTDQTLVTPTSGNVTITYVNVVSTSGDTKDTTPPSISNVTVSDITPFGAVVKFSTNEDTDGFVKYGKDTTYGDVAGDEVWAKTHTIRIRGLTLGTEYHIKVSANDKAGNTGTSADQTFKTTFLSENLKDMANVENIEQFQKEIESAIESILPSLVPPFITKPVISDITESGATVSFKTNIKSFPVAVYAEDGAYDETKENPYTGEVSDTAEKATAHSLKLTGLKGNTKYHVQARGFSLPKVIGKSTDVTFITKASKIAGSIVERKKDSFTVVWTTEQPTSSIVEYKDLKRGITGRKTDNARKTSHSMKIENLPSGTAYEVNLSGVTEQGNVAEAGSPISVTTSTDTTPPAISGFKVDNALVPGRTDRIQTIVSWFTDEPSTSTAYYEEGAGTPGDTEELASKNEILDSYVTNHSVILPSLKPGTIYRLKVISTDDSGNEGSFGPRTVITPKQTESITDIIFKNFEDSFKFLQKI